MWGGLYGHESQQGKDRAVAEWMNGWIGERGWVGRTSQVIVLHGALLLGSVRVHPGRFSVEGLAELHHVGPGAFEATRRGEEIKDLGGWVGGWVGGCIRTLHE